MHQADRRGPPAGGEGGQIPGYFKHDIDAATLLAAARAVRCGAWWRAVRREGWTRAPGVARGFGILAVLACLAVGGWVSLPSPRGLFRGGEIREGAVDRARGRTGPLSPSGMENDAMRAMNLSAAMVAGAMLANSSAFAQAAVEWKVSDGGNGHWYGVLVESPGLSWVAARDRAQSVGGHLASITSLSEDVFAFNLANARNDAWTGPYSLGPWLGGQQQPGSAEPAGGWVWVTGEAWSYRLPTSWNSAQGLPAGDADNGGGSGFPEDSLHYIWRSRIWNDAKPSGDYFGDGRVCSMLVEWDGDCNGDGIVDYGQILSGELADANANNTPDCCEQGTGCPANIVTNGSFEAGTPLNACSSESVAARTSIGTGWQVTSGSVQRVRANSSCAAQGTPKFGDFFVDLLDAGEIRQAVATTPGRSYRLTFWVSGDCAGGPTTKRVTASLGTAMQSFDHACSGSGTQAWRSCSVEFIANSAITTLSLKSAAGGATNGPLVDGVRVEDISISCPGDVDGDGSVTGGDVSLVLLNFGDCPSN